MKNINIKRYKTWIIIFGLFNAVLLLWSAEVFPILKNPDDIKKEVIIISPEYKFIKITPPKDKQFPNDKSDIWDAYNDDNKKSKINIKESKENKTVVGNGNNSKNKLKLSENNFNEIQESKAIKGKENKEDKLIASKKDINNELKKTETKLSKKKDRDKIVVKEKTIVLDDKDIINKKTHIKSKTKTNSFYVQTASLSKKELVAKEWDRIQKKYKLDAKNLIFITEKTKLQNNQVFYRLLVGKFKSNDEAKIFCKKIKFKNSCIIKIIE